MSQTTPAIPETAPRVFEVEACEDLDSTIYGLILDRLTRALFQPDIERLAKLDSGTAVYQECLGDPQLVIERARRLSENPDECSLKKVAKTFRTVCEIVKRKPEWAKTCDYKVFIQANSMAQHPRFAEQLLPRDNSSSPWVQPLVMAIVGSSEAERYRICKELNRRMSGRFTAYADMFARAPPSSEDLGAQPPAVGRRANFDQKYDTRNETARKMIDSALASVPLEYLNSSLSLVADAGMASLGIIERELGYAMLAAGEFYDSFYRPNGIVVFHNGCMREFLARWETMRTLAVIHNQTYNALALALRFFEKQSVEPEVIIYLGGDDETTRPIYDEVFYQFSSVRKGKVRFFDGRQWRCSEGEITWFV